MSPYRHFWYRFRRYTVARWVGGGYVGDTYRLSRGGICGGPHVATFEFRRRDGASTVAVAWGRYVPRRVAEKFAAAVCELDEQAFKAIPDMVLARLPDRIVEVAEGARTAVGEAA